MEKSGKKKLRLLLVEDEENDAVLLLRRVKSSGYEVEYRQVKTEEDLRSALSSVEWEIVISDFTLPSFSGIEALKIVREIKPHLPFILVSGTVGEENAVEALKSGANDFLLKDKLTRLVPAIERELHSRQEHIRIANELKAKEEELRQSQKLESIGRLAGGIAHDFNNTLAIITLSANTLLSPQISEDEIIKGVDHILKASEKAANLTKQLLAFSRKQVLIPQVIHPSERIRDFKTMLDRIVGDDIELIFSNGTASPIKIDPGQLDQILMNLVVNARDAMPKGGRIEIGCRDLVADLKFVDRYPFIQPGKYVMISIKDTGSGMDETTKAHIFEPFFSTKEKEKGSGLGLATVYGIVKQSGGVILVESELGKGSEFQIYLPVTDEKPNIVEATEPSVKATGKTKNIMVVEDEPMLRDLIKLTLVAKGHHVEVFERPDQAIDSCANRTDKFDLLLTDMVLAGQSGLDLIKALQKRFPGIQCIVMSGFAEQDIFDTEYGIGSLIPFLQKPFSQKTLLDTIYNLDAQRVKEE